jgi:group II intron maturase
VNAEQASKRLTQEPTRRVFREGRRLGTTPSQKRVQRISQAISKATRRNTTQQAVEQIVAQLNRQMIGWANYFCLGPVSKAYRTLERHTCRRLASGCAPNITGREHVPSGTLTDSCTTSLGWFVSMHEPSAFRGQDREPFSESWMHEMCLSSSMSGKRKQSHVKPD